MQLLEHVAKAVAAEACIPIPRGEVATTPAEAEAIAAEIGALNERLRADGTVAGWWEILSGAQRDPLVGGTILTCRDVTNHVNAERAEAMDGGDRRVAVHDAHPNVGVPRELE